MPRPVLLCPAPSGRLPLPHALTQARSPDPVPRGEAAFQLYSLATPNGQKIGILLEELGVDYDAFVVNIGKGEQFSQGFVAVNPNSKIPCGAVFSQRTRALHFGETAPVGSSRCCSVSLPPPLPLTFSVHCGSSTKRQRLHD